MGRYDSIRGSASDLIPNHLERGFSVLSVPQRLRTGLLPLFEARFVQINNQTGIYMIPYLRNNIKTLTKEW